MEMNISNIAIQTRTKNISKQNSQLTPIITERTSPWLVVHFGVFLDVSSEVVLIENGHLAILAHGAKLLRRGGVGRRFWVRAWEKKLI